ncbi:hypothetical protein M408DRAFT_234148 [Serendipita vermifera MAFF 305830]|uniref:Uncharacterized protein n=1 Tax=Serendipita vermifera MAFF 305830 TaxID=933852 RepID=A0A0C2WCV5_SERVB|nr:hypothetical protein M408DRAFT_234148 [Serendipita vermifera MAFF 305830]
MQQNNETIDAVRAAVATHVPMDIKGHLNEFSKSLAEEVRLLLREVGKLREEKRNIQYEIGCMLCLKSKYGPGGEFDPEWRPTTGPLAEGPPMPSAPGEENPVPPPDDRPMTAPPAWRTIHTKRKAPKKREQQAPPASVQAPAPAPPPAMPSAPAPVPMPMPVHHHVPTAPPASAMPPPSMMDQSRQQSWYAWQRKYLSLWPRFTDAHYFYSRSEIRPLVPFKCSYV